MLVCIKIKQVWVRHEMLEKLERQNLQTLKIPSDQVRWYKKNKEIIVNNQLFDVKDFNITNEVATFKGLYDTRETALKNIVAKSGNAEQNKKVISCYFVSLLFQNTNHIIECPPQLIAYTDSGFNIYKKKLLSYFTWPLTPPPKTMRTISA